MKITNLLIFLSLLSFSVFSQTESKQRLTYKEALQIGLKNSVDFKSQQNLLDARAAQKVQAYGNYLPSLNAQGFAQRTDGLQIDPTTGSASNLTSDYIQGTLNANYILFNGFGRINTLKQNNYLFSAQSSLLKRSKQDIVYNVTSQFLQVLLDQELMRIAEENLALQGVILEQTKGYVEVGSRAEADQYTQDALVKNAEVTLLRAKITLENDRATLLQTLQLDPSVEIEVVRSDWEIDTNYFKSLSLDSLYRIAENYREDLRQQNYLVEASQSTMRLNSSGYYPTLSLFASYGSTYYATDSWKSNPDVSRPASFREQFTNLNPALTYGINLQIPIFDRFQTRSSRITSKVTYENNILTRDNLVKKIKIDVQRSFKNYQTSLQSYDASLIEYQAGELALKTQKESYDLGIASQVELATANQTFVQAAASKAQAEVTLFFQQMLLEYALGTISIENLIGN